MMQRNRCLCSCLLSSGDDDGNLELKLWPSLAAGILPSRQIQHTATSNILCTTASSCHVSFFFQPNDSMFTADAEFSECVGWQSPVSPMSPRRPHPWACGRWCAWSLSQRKRRVAHRTVAERCWSRPGLTFDLQRDQPPSQWRTYFEDCFPGNKQVENKVGIYINL